MEPLLKVPVQKAHAHALPFRIVFEEYRRRRAADLLGHAATVLCTARRGIPDAAIGEELAARIALQESCYATLEAEAVKIATGERNQPLDSEVRRCHKADRPLLRILHAMDASAVCLSGGGIRCATISLGVLEGLSRYSGTSEAGLMHRLDYLSTVSGGGYMGSWMMAWVYREMEALGGSRLLQDALSSTEDALQETRADAPDLTRLVDLTGTADTSFNRWKVESAGLPLKSALDALAGGYVVGPAVLAAAGLATPDPASTVNSKVALDALREAISSGQSVLQAMLGLIAEAAYANVVKGLAGRLPTTAGDPEPLPVRHLRSYTSDLAPDLGLTLDTFALVAILLRNFVVNWSMLVPVLIAAIAALELSGALMAYVRAGTIHWLKAPVHPAGTWGDLTVMLLFLGAAIAAGLGLPSHAKKWGVSNEMRGWLPFVFIGFVLAGVWLLTATTGDREDNHVFKVTSLIAGVGYLSLTFSIWWTYRNRASSKRVSFSRKVVFVGLAGLAASVCMAAAAGGLLYALQTGLFVNLLDTASNAKHIAKADLFVVFGVPLVMTVLLLTTSIYCALLGIYEGEDDREWWARCGGAFTGFSLAWIVAHALALYGRGWFVALTSAIAGAVLGLASSVLGFSGSTSAAKDTTKTSGLSSLGKFLVKHDLILPVVGGTAILFIAMAMVWVEEQLRGVLRVRAHLAQSNYPWLHCRLPRQLVHQGVLSALAMFVLAGALALVLNWAININLFSLHGMYRMRLMRAFLGASNVFRKPDPFTQFDLKDTPRQAEMPCFAGSPMHLLNATLNLTGTKNAAWRQRKAEGFSFSPVACGGWRVGFVPTPLYAGSKGKNQRERGLTLATAMAISGAAANPNMGYQSSPVLSLLMTFFDLRLGCWLPNPGRPLPRRWLQWLPIAQNEKFFAKTGPSFALRPLLAEALQLTDDTYRWVELTDGGHFEDLALYEMVLRRVKHIVLVDGGADATFGFEDLGNAVRKIEIDLGIPIEFASPLRMRKGIDADNRYCAVGRIRYGCVDPVLGGQRPGGDDARDGWVVYIKGCLNGNEPEDILQYARTHATFPHETTADQFFTESQFESYRHLGSFAIQTMAGTDGPGDGQASMTDLTRLAKRYWTRQRPTAVKGLR